MLWVLWQIVVLLAVAILVSRRTGTTTGTKKVDRMLINTIFETRTNIYAIFRWSGRPLLGGDKFGLSGGQNFNPGEVRLLAHLGKIRSKFLV